MMGANFQEALLMNIDFRHTSAMGANFNKANLSGGDLRSGSFMGAYFEKSNLRRTKLQGAAFMDAFLEKADFRGAEFDEVALWSISKAHDYSEAKFDVGVIEKINALKKIRNYSSGNLMR